MENKNKNELREAMLKKRDSQSLEEKARKDAAIFEKFIASEYYNNSKVIFIFVSFRSEVDTHRIIERAINDGKIVCVPKVISRKEGMKAFIINDFKDLKEGYFGILEPSEKCPEIERNKIDIAVMPGAAFDRNGGRIGYGGGFYDRFLKDLESIKKIALAYDFQVLEKVPMDENDVRIDGVITN